MLKNSTETQPHVKKSKEPVVIISDEEDLEKRKNSLVISSDDEEASCAIISDGKVKENVKSTSTNFPKQKKVTNVLLLCPLSTPALNCTRCCVVRSIAGKTIHCHCSSKQIFCDEGRTQPAEKHWVSSEWSIYLKNILRYLIYILTLDLVHFLLRQVYQYYKGITAKQNAVSLEA